MNTISSLLLFAVLSWTLPSSEMTADGWIALFDGTASDCRVKQHRFAPVKAEKVRITATRHQGNFGLCEVGVY